MKINLQIFLLFLIILFCSCIPEPKQIIVVPGLGLIISTDTIKLSKTKESEVFRIFKLKDTLIKINMGTSCGFNANGESETSETYHKKINCDGIIFNYSSFKNKDSLTLEKIEISDTTHWSVKINDSIILGKSIPNILQYFPKRDDNDEYDNYWNNLYSYGVNLGLSKMGSQKKLSYISIYTIN